MTANTGVKLGPEQDIDLLKAVIKDLFSNTEGKKSISWDKVARYMSTDVKPDTLRKRFDKFKPEKADRGAGGGGKGEKEAAASAKQKRAPAKPKTEKAKGTAKKAEVEEKVEDENKPVEESHTKGEDEPSPGKEASTTTATPEDKKVKKATKPREPKVINDADVIEAEKKLTKKRARPSATPKGNGTDTEGHDDEDKLASNGLLTPPKRGRPTETENTAKKVKPDAVAATGEEEGKGLQV